MTVVARSNREEALIEEGRVLGMREAFRRIEACLGAEEARRIVKSVLEWDKRNQAAAVLLAAELRDEVWVDFLRRTAAGRDVKAVGKP